MIEKYSEQAKRQINRYYILMPIFTNEAALLKHEEIYFRQLNMSVIPYAIDKKGYEQLYELIETLKLEKWEHPAWIAEVIDTLYRCLENDSDGPSERATQLFQKLCTLNITKAATFRLGSV